MQAFLSIAANRAVDDYAINTCGIPGQTLMQTAGEAVVHQMDAFGFLNNTPDILVLAGHGNNGGDGYVIATDLKERNLNVIVLMVVGEAELRGDALYHYQRLKKMNLTIEVWENTKQQMETISEADLIVDALLGTGIKGEIRAPYDTLITQANSSEANIVSVDVPSGVTGDFGSTLTPCIQADLTVSMGFGKQGCLFEPAQSHCGKVVVVEIGFPKDSLKHVEGHVLDKPEEQDFSLNRYTRAMDAHKYSSGKVLIIAGSKGFSGAAILAARAALRSGAGLVRLAIPESLGPIAETASLETVVDYLPETETQGLALGALNALNKGVDWADTIVLGPGIGRHQETVELVRQLVQGINKPLVLDADGLFALNNNLKILDQRDARTLITPHAGEFKRLVGMKDEQAPTWKDAVDFAQRYKISVLLKGAPSVLASPSGQVTVNSSGYSGMATAGSGDVLSGICGALWAQWLDDPQVLNLAMFIHGKAADQMRREKGVLGLIASDIVSGLPGALKEYGGVPT